MSTERWRTIERLFHDALELPPEDRSRFLEAHAPDAEARAEILALLAADGDPDALFGATPEALAGAAGLVTAPLVGRTVGPYRVLERIGQGGMGTVYRAVREDLGNQVALKVVRGALGEPARLARFRQEQRLLARLEHERIARLLDAGVAGDDTPYLVMEYVEGEPITAWCDARGLGVEDRLRLFLEVCDAVAFAHRNLIVHRDLKPSNVLVAGDGHVKLLDFGVAKLLEEAGDDPGLTATGMRVLSPEYAAPEQVRGEAVTTATDVYGLGLLLYELLSGRRAQPVGRMGRTDPAAVVAAVLDAEALAPSSAVRRGGGRGRDHDGNASAPGGGGSGDANAGARAGDDAAAGTPGAAHVTGGDPATGPTRGVRVAGPPGDDRTRARRLAGDLDAICLCALEKDPARRYASAELFRDDVVRHLEGRPVNARLPTLGYRLGKFVRRHAVGVAAAAVLVLVLAGGIGAVLWQAERAERARAASEELSNFLVRLFEASDPNEALGREVTARDLLERGTIRAGRLGDRPEIQARMLDAMAQAYLGLGDYERADSLVERSLARERALHGEHHADIARSLATLGRIRREQGRDAAADTLLRASLALRRELLGGDDDLTTRTMLELAYTLRLRGSYDEAEALAREALAARVARHGPDDERIALALESLALVSWASGRDLEQAETLLRNALAMRERLWGADDPRIEVALTPLSVLLVSVGKAAEAETVARRALEIRRHVYGDDHPMVTHQLNNVARAIEAQGRIEEAREMYREMVRRYGRVFPGDHPMIAVAINNISATFYKEGALDSAEHYLRQSLEMRLRLHDGVDANVALLYHNLGSLQRAQGRLEEAERSLAEAYRQRIEIYGAENPVALRTGAAYGDVLAARGKLDQAEPLLREIMKQQVARFGEDSENSARTMGYLANVLTRRGAYAEAEALYLPALEVARAHMPPTHPRRRALVAGLVRLYEAWGRPEAAERVRREEAAAARGN